MSSISTRGQQCATEMTCIGKPICLIKLTHKLLFLHKLRAKTSFWTKWDKYNMEIMIKSQTGQTANDRHYVIFTKIMRITIDSLSLV